MLQRTLELDIGKIDILKGKNAEEAFDTILTGLEQTAGATGLVLINWRTKAKRHLILQVLDEWITAPPGDMKNPDRKRHALSRHYASYHDIASAVLDRVRSLPAVVIEENLATEISTNEAVKQRLVKFVHANLLPWVTTVRSQYNATLKSLDEPIARLASINRLYLPYLERGEVSIADILGNPTDKSIATLISAIHDLAEILYHPEVGEESAKTLVEVPEDKLQGVVLEESEPPSAEPPAESKQALKVVTPAFTRRPLGEYRGKRATPLQSNAQVATAGKLGYPVSLGPSRTTGKLMMLAEAASATTEMKEAIAWAIFSLWYLEYRRDLTDIHRYHFVMDMAAAFGVPYNPVGVPQRPGGGDYSALIKTSRKEARGKARGIVGPQPPQPPVAPVLASPLPATTTRTTMSPQVKGAVAEPALTEHQRAILLSFRTAKASLVELPAQYTDIETQARFGLSKADFDAAWVPLWKRGKNNKNALVRPIKDKGLELTSKGSAQLSTL